MRYGQPFSFKKWIDEHRDVLKPPVGNAQVFKDVDNFIIMVVGGPNSRNDFHYNESEEFFYMLEGNMILRVHDEGEINDIPIKEGEIFLLPAKVPHSPQREANSIGLVVEKVRTDDETDGFILYCQNCGNKLYEEYFHLEDIVKQLPPVMKRFNDNEDLRTCSNCGTVMESK